MSHRSALSLSYSFFFFNDPAPTEIYTLSLHDALPIPRFVMASRAQPCSSAQSARVRIEDGSTIDRKSTRLNSSHLGISYAVFCLKKKKKKAHAKRGRSTEQEVQKNMTTLSSMQH